MFPQKKTPWRWGEAAGVDYHPRKQGRGRNQGDLAVKAFPKLLMGWTGRDAGGTLAKA